MQLSLGCCCDPDLPPWGCVPVCSESGGYDENTIILSMTAPTWSYSSESKAFTYNSGDADVHFFVPDISAVGGGDKMLRKRRSGDGFGNGMLTGGSLCQWLWNDVTAIPSLWLWPNFLNCNSPFFPPPYTEAEIAEGTPYTPENATNASWPWDRVFVANPDALCSTCYCSGCGSMSANPRGHYRCGNMRVFTAACLYIYQGGAPSGGFPTVGTGHYYWVLKYTASTCVSSTYNRTLAASGISETHLATSNAGTLGIDTLFPPDFGGELVGGNLFDATPQALVTVMYAKEVDCSSDFDGTPVTIPFWEIIGPSNDLTLTLDTYPSSLTIEFQARPTGVDDYTSESGSWESPVTGDVEVECWGPGGGGGAGGAGSGSNGGSGGGGGGYCKKTISVTAGQLVPYSIGAVGVGGIDAGTGQGGAGTATTAAGTLTANGGAGGDYGDNDPTVAAAGGTATGGDINTSGSSSSAVTIGNDGGAGGAGANGGAGGAGGIESGAAAAAGTSPGGGGGGGARSGEPGAAGATGRVRFTY